MTTQTKEVSRDQILSEAAEAAELERSLVDQLNSLPGRYAEARQAAISRFNVARGYLLAGHTTEVPSLDLSEAQAILDSEADLKSRAKQAGLTKLRMFAAYHRVEAQEHQETYESLAPALDDLEQQHARISNDLKALRNARATVHKRHQVSWQEALSYERAATFAEQAPDPFVRMG